MSRLNRGSAESPSSSFRRQQRRTLHRETPTGPASGRYRTQPVTFDEIKVNIHPPLCRLLTQPRSCCMFVLLFTLHHGTAAPRKKGKNEKQRVYTNLRTSLLSCLPHREQLRFCLLSGTQKGLHQSCTSNVAIVSLLFCLITCSGRGASHDWSFETFPADSRHAGRSWPEVAKGGSASVYFYTRCIGHF